MLIALLLIACTANEPAPPGEAPVEATHEPTAQEALASAMGVCLADDACRESLPELPADAQGDGSCDVWKAVECSAIVAAAVACCVDIEACPECVELAASTGCCDCIPAGPVRDACKAI